ncbi:STAS domain-containing protein [Rugamonas aquatica]|uniref:Anti-sigma factor antagonist n=1 Tax=Rugamonas aquatica TaxID=2743357 RepID=A0A6A7N6G9_9BURK|nr:STAS domain-containing protein [Rugamonas aquatica]MQA40694.1 anti-sigma factor antagonist [Rugamonas aquatica]
MHIHTETRDDIHIVRLQGRIDSATAGAFDQAIGALFDCGAHKLVLEFSQLDYISSAGMRSALIAGKKVRLIQDGKLVLCALRPHISEIFAMSGLNALFLICADLESALEQLA